MYESMKVRLENVLERGKVDEEYITSELERKALSKWTDEFTRQDHSTIIQVCFIKGLLFVLEKNMFILSKFKITIFTNFLHSLIINITYIILE